MTFLVLDVQKNFMVQQRSRLEFEQLVNTNNLNNVTSHLTNLAQNENTDMESEPVLRLQDLQQKYDSTNTSLESQLKALNAQIESFTKAIDNNIKSGCKLNLLS